MDSLTAVLQRCRRAGICIVQDGPDRRCRDRIIAHECYHLYQWRNGLHKRRTPRILLEHPVTRKALPYLEKSGYDIDDAEVVLSELSAYTVSGDNAYIGLRRKEAREWLALYFQHTTPDKGFHGER